MIGFSSVTKWSKSFFGGSMMLIKDHPTVKVPPEIDVEPSLTLKADLGFYYSEVLLKIYLYQATISNIERYEELVKNCYSSITEEDIVIKRVWNPKISQMEEKQFFKVPIKFIYDHLTLDECFDEYLELYDEYNDGFFKSYFLHEIPKQDKEEKGSGKKGDSKEDSEKEDGTSDKEEEIPESFEESLEKSLQEIKIYSRFISDSLSDFDQTPIFKKLPKTYTKEAPLSKDSNFYGSYLAKLLDIDFEPKSDVIKSLKTGKLDLSKICEVPAGNLNVYQRVEEDVDTQTFSVVIIADMSGSMECGGRILKQKLVLDTLYEALKDKLKDRLFIFGHSGDYTPEIYTFLKPGEDNYLKDHQNYKFIELHQNYDGPVLESIYQKVRSHTNEKILLITLSDGLPCGNNYGGPKDDQNLKRIIEKLNRDNFITTCLGIDSPGVEDLYKYGLSLNFAEKTPNEYMKDIAMFINKVVRLELK